MTAIQPIRMPKWGLSMEEGMVARWMVDEGAEIAHGQEIMDIETTKIANVFESPVAGILRRRIADEGATLPVGALLGVVADRATADSDLDSYIADFQAKFSVAEREQSDAPAPEFVEAGGRRLRHLKAGGGDATPIVLIHGFGSDLTSWMFNQTALAEDRVVYAVDLPGHGGSVKDVGTGSLEDLAAAITDYLDAAGIGRAHLVGHSLGGAIAASIASASPDRVSALTLIAPAGLGREIAGDFIAGFMAESRARKLRRFIEMLVADPNLITADMVEEILKFKRLDGALAALQAIAVANFPGGAQTVSLRDAVAAIEAPVQIIWGEADRILPPAHAEGLPQTITVSRIAGAGHIPHMEKAAEVNQLIKALG
jgi:pyruvate dehydrogenase E2 component (dihydrolipoamide acetyltransferase)